MLLSQYVLIFLIISLIVWYLGVRSIKVLLYIQEIRTVTVPRQVGIPVSQPSRRHVALSAPTNKKPILQENVTRDI